MAWRARLAASPWWTRGGADVVLLALIAALGVLLHEAVRVGFWSGELPPRHAWHVLEGALWAAIVLLVLIAPLRARRALLNPVLGTVGLLSYSLFIVHVPAVCFALWGMRAVAPSLVDGWRPFSLAFVAVVLAVSLALSALTYRVVERPFLVRKARLTR
jgi:peptidoglycan/LPS O-acetylase OafA/YrhL